MYNGSIWHTIWWFSQSIFRPTIRATKEQTPHGIQPQKCNLQLNWPRRSDSSKAIHLMNIQRTHCTCGEHNFFRESLIVNDGELWQLNVIHASHWTSTLPVKLNVICGVSIWEAKEKTKFRIYISIHRIGKVKFGLWSVL